MPSKAYAILVGHTGKDPDSRYTPQGQPVTSFSVAVSRYRGQEEHTDWFKVTCWGKLAERCNEKVYKGALVQVSGRLSLESWEGNDGVTRSQMSVNADDVLVLSKRAGATEEGIEPEELAF